MSDPDVEQSPVVFVVDDDGGVRDALLYLFQSVGLQVKTFTSASEFFQSKLPNCPSCLVLDVRLQGASGLDFQSNLNCRRNSNPDHFYNGPW